MGLVSNRHIFDGAAFPATGKIPNICSFVLKKGVYFLNIVL